MKKEEWKDIVGYEGLYQISNYGNVKSLPRFHKTKDTGYYSKEKILKPTKDNLGYLHVRILGKDGYKTKRIHLLVAKAFIDNPYNLPVVNHINGDKADNYFKNLEWCTHQDNVLHAYKIGLKKNNKGLIYKKRCQLAIKYIQNHQLVFELSTMQQIKEWFDEFYKDTINILEGKNND